MGQGRPRLTRRQQEFLSRFLELYHQVQEPVHYAEVARHLGVSKVTAYEMLRLLEERGLVRSEFRLPRERRGPGRAQVVFMPTRAAHQALRELAGPAVEEENWGTIKARILDRLREGRAAGYEDLLEDLLARLPERRSPLRYTAELITALLLALRTLLEGPYGQMLRERLRRIGAPGELGLNALTGLTLALGLAERINRRISTRLLAEVNRFHQTLLQLSEKQRGTLTAFLKEVLDILFEEETPNQEAESPSSPPAS